MTTFFSYKALISQRSSGYKNTTFALAELIDNAFDAKATKVRIIFVERRDENTKKYIDEIIIADDGYGMSDGELQACLQFGGGVNSDIDEIVREKKKGKFGYGLPNASLSQCPCVHVYSRQDGTGYSSVYLDLDELSDTESIEIPAVSEVKIPPWYEKVGAVVGAKRGVIVSWRRCDRLMNSRASTIVEKSEELLGRLFRYVIQDGGGIRMLVYEHNSGSGAFTKTVERDVLPNDPLFLLQNTVIARYLYSESKKAPGIGEHQEKIAARYAKYSQSEKQCDATNDRVQDHCYVYKFLWRGKTYKFPIVTSVAKNDIQKPGIREGGSTKVGAFYGKKDSICFVRSDREIASGSFGGFYKATDARNRWWTVEVRFDADADDLLGVHNNKQGIEFSYTKDFDPSEKWEPHTATLQQARDRLWYELTGKLELARKAALKTVLKAHKEWDLQEAQEREAEGPVLPEATTRAQEVATTVDGLRKRQFSEEERKALQDRLQDKYPSLTEEHIKRAVDRFDYRMSRGCVLYQGSESESLWTLTTVFDFLIVLINTEHEFFKAVIAPLQRARADGAVAALELFISSLAFEEVEHFSKGKEKDVIEMYRSYVGLHLNRYLRELNLSEYVLNEEDLEGEVDEDEEVSEA